MAQQWVTCVKCKRLRTVKNMQQATFLDDAHLDLHTSAGVWRCSARESCRGHAKRARKAARENQGAARDPILDTRSDHPDVLAVDRLDK